MVSTSVLVISGATLAAAALVAQCCTSWDTRKAVLEVTILPPVLALTLGPTQ